MLDATSDANSMKVFKFSTIRVPRLGHGVTKLSFENLILPGISRYKKPYKGVPNKELFRDGAVYLAPTSVCQLDDPRGPGRLPCPPHTIAQMSPEAPLLQFPVTLIAHFPGQDDAASRKYSTKHPAPDNVQ